MANINAVSTAANTSSEFTLAAGDSTTLSLSTATTGVSAPTFATAEIQIKSAGGTFQTIGTLDYDTPILVLNATGTFRVAKSSGTPAFGVERD